MEWIKCEDRLPKNPKTVLVWYEYYGLWGKSGGYGLSWYSEHKGWDKSDLMGDNIRVLLWAPLPKAPTEVR